MIREITSSVLPIILLLAASTFFISCSASDTTFVEVNKSVFLPDTTCIEVSKSAFLPDCEELLVDSLMADGVKICSMAQRYYHKSMGMGGGDRRGGRTANRDRRTRDTRTRDRDDFFILIKI